MNKQKKAHRLGKKVILGVLLFVGALIIALASFVGWHFFFPKKIPVTTLSSTLSDFVYLYEDNNAMRDLPEGLEITASNCVVSADQKSFTYTLTLVNRWPMTKNFAYQLYYNEEFIQTYGTRVGNPLSRSSGLESAVLTKNETKTIEVSGVIYGQGDAAVAQFKENFAHVYFEVILDKEIGRILLPVRFS